MADTEDKPQKKDKEQVNFSGLTKEQKAALVELRGSGSWKELTEWILTRAREEEALKWTPDSRRVAQKIDTALNHIRDLVVGEISAHQELVDGITDRMNSENAEVKASLNEAEAELKEVRKELEAAIEKAKRVDELEQRNAKAEKERDAAIEKADNAELERDAAKADAMEAMKQYANLQAEAAKGKDALARIDAMSERISDLQASVKDARQERDEAKDELKALRERMGE